jgi:hypothetical protein
MCHPLLQLIYYINYIIKKMEAAKLVLCDRQYDLDHDLLQPNVQYMYYGNELDFGEISE